MSFAMSPGFDVTCPMTSKEGSNDAQQWGVHWIDFDNEDIALGAEYWAFFAIQFDSDSAWPVAAFEPSWNLHVGGSNPAFNGIASSPDQVDFSNGTLKRYIRGGGTFDPNTYGPGVPGYHDVFNIQRPVLGTEPAINKGITYHISVNGKLHPSAGFQRMWYRAMDGSMPGPVKICDESNIPTMYNGDPGPLSAYFCFYTKGSPAESSANDGKVFKLKVWVPCVGSTAALASAHTPSGIHHRGALKLDTSSFSSIAALDMSTFSYPDESGLSGSGGTTPPPVIGTPFASDLPDHFGKDTVGALTASLTKDFTRGIVRTAGKTGPIPLVRLYGAGDPAQPGVDGVAKANIYEVIGGVPGRLLGTSDEVTVTGGDAPGPIDFPFTMQPNVVQGQPYLIDIISGDTTGVIIIYYDAVVNGAHFNPDTYSDGPSTTWPLPDQLNQIELSVVAQVVGVTTLTGRIGKITPGALVNGDDAGFKFGRRVLVPALHTYRFDDIQAYQGGKPASSGTETYKLVVWEAQQTIGHTAIETTLEPDDVQDIEVQGPVSPAVPGFLDTGMIRLSGVPGGGIGHIRKVVYEMVSGDPTVFVHESNEVIVQPTDPMSNRQFVFPGQVPLDPAKSYCHGWRTDGNVIIAGVADTPGSTFNLGVPYVGPAPSVWPTTGTGGDSGHTYTMSLTLTARDGAGVAGKRLNVGSTNAFTVANAMTWKTYQPAGTLSVDGGPTGVEAVVGFITTGANAGQTGYDSGSSHEYSADTAFGAGGSDPFGPESTAAGDLSIFVDYTDITPTLPVMLAPPTIAGTPTVGSVMAGTDATWIGLVTIEHWWEDDVTGSYVQVSSGASHTNTQNENKHHLRFVTRATNSKGSTTVASTPILIASTTKPVNLTPPSIVGVTQSGKTLSQVPGTWADADTVSPHWEILNSGVWVPILGATGSTFTQTSIYVGRTISLVEVASNANGSISIRSAPVTVQPAAVATNSMGIYRAATNLHGHGQVDAATQHLTTSGVTKALDATGHPPFSSQSVKLTLDGSGANQGVVITSATGLAKAAGTLGVSSTWFKGVAGHRYFAATEWLNTDASLTLGASADFIATGAWQLITPPTPIAVPVAKTGDQLRIRVVNDVATAEIFHVAHTMLESGHAVVAPYVATTGGATATHGAARAQASATGLSATNFWAAVWMDVGFPAAVEIVNKYLWAWAADATNEKIQLLWDATAKQWKLTRVHSGVAGNIAAVASGSFVAGDPTFLFIAGDATKLYISLNGGKLVTVTNNKVPTGLPGSYDLGNSLNTGQIDSRLRWAAAGTIASALKDADMAALYALGSDAPITAKLPKSLTVKAIIPMIDASYYVPV